MKRFRPVLLWLLLAIAIPFVTAPANAGSDHGDRRRRAIKVVGQNDIHVDRQAIQDAIDSAPEKKAVVELRGTFQLDGTPIIVDRSHLTLRGGRKGATLLGVIDEVGLPEGGELFNRGIQINGEDLVEDVVIKNLTLIGHFRAIQMGDIAATGGLLCGELVVTPGVEDIVVKNNRMENNVRAVQVNGSAEDIEIRNNEIHGSLEGGIIFLGGQIDCDGDPGFLEIGVLSEVVVKDNSSSVAETSPFPLPSALFMDGPNRDVLVKNNTFEGGATAVYLGGDVWEIVLTKNRILEGGTQGLPFLRAGGISMGIPGLPFSPPRAM